MIFWEKINKRNVFLNYTYAINKYFHLTTIILYVTNYITVRQKNVATMDEFKVRLLCVIRPDLYLANDSAKWSNIFSQSFVSFCLIFWNATNSGEKYRRRVSKGGFVHTHPLATSQPLTFCVYKTCTVFAFRYDSEFRGIY